MAFKYSMGQGQVTIRFDGKPDEGIRSILKANGFRWSPQAGIWYRNRINGAADFLAALDRKMNPNRPDGKCWTCSSPDGFFRPRGAATPVLCEACHQKEKARTA